MKTVCCERCKKDIIIRPTQIGAFWYLNGWGNQYGVKFWGGYCNKCFGILHGGRPRNVKTTKPLVSHRS